jgi:general secretion pathway protein J
MPASNSCSFRNQGSTLSLNFFASWNRRTSGFTLIEILIAIVLFGIIATTIFGSYRSVFSDATTLNSHISDDEAAMICIDRMIRDLHSATFSFPPQYQPPGLNSKPDPHRFLGRIELLGGKSFPALQFTSRSVVPMEADIQDRISELLYYVDEVENDYYILRRADHPYPRFSQPKSSQDPILCQKVKSITVTYYGKDGKTYDRWDSDSREFDYTTPKAVGVRIETGDRSPFRIYETTIFIPSYRNKSYR